MTETEGQILVPPPPLKKTEASIDTEHWALKKISKFACRVGKLITPVFYRIQGVRKLSDPLLSDTFHHNFC
jgi:hypothetical protein